MQLSATKGKIATCVWVHDFVLVRERERALTHNEVQKKAYTLHCSENKIITAVTRSRKIQLQ